MKDKQASIHQNISARQMLDINSMIW